MGAGWWGLYGLALPQALSGWPLCFSVLTPRIPQGRCAYLEHPEKLTLAEARRPAGKMEPRSRWASCLPPGSSVAWTALRAGWLADGSAIPCSSPTFQLWGPGAWGPKLWLPRPTQPQIRASATGPLMCQVAPSPHGLYLLSSSFSLAGWGNFHLVFILSNLKLFLNIIFGVNHRSQIVLLLRSLCKALTLLESSCLSPLGRLRSLGSWRSLPSLNPSPFPARGGCFQSQQWQGSQGCDLSSASAWG